LNNNPTLRFTGIFSLCLIILGVFASYPIYRFGNSFIYSGTALNLAFFYVITIISFYIVARSFKKSGSVINAFLGGIVLKLLVAMVYLLFVLKKFPSHEVDFVISFFASYLICTGFEVYYILYNLRQN